MYQNPCKQKQVLKQMENVERSADENDENDFLTDDEEEQNENADPSLSQHKQDTSLLKRNLRRLETQNNKLHDEIKILEDKLTFNRTKTRELEQKHSKDLRTVQKCAQLKVDEREKLVGELRMFIDKQQAQIHQLQEERGEEVLFSVANSVNNFVKQITDLQDENVKLKEENIKTCAKMEDMTTEIVKLKESISTNYVMLEDYQCLLKEKEILSRIRTPAKASFDETALRNEINSLREELVNCRKTETELDKKNSVLKKKVLELESKCTTLMYAPPKIHYREVIDESSEKKLRLVEDEKFALEQKMKSKENEHQRQIERVEGRMSFMKGNIKRLDDRDDSHLKQCKDFLENIKDLRSRLENQRRKSENLERELEKASVQLEHYQMLRHEREQQMASELQEKYSQLQMDCQKKDETFKRLVSRFRELSSELKEFRKIKDHISGDLKFLNTSLTCSLSDVKDKILHAVSDTSHQASLLSVRYKKEIQLRKQLHNELVQLKGNIRVLCRVRPLIKEDGDGCSNIVSFDDEDESVLFVKHKDSVRTFHMDSVFMPTSTQQQVFEDVKSLVTSCLDGYNVCIFAYGQTGSGKTYTMEGTKNNPGINQQALKYLFQHSEEMKDWRFIILVSFVEIYNDMLRDLLSATPTAKLEVKQQKDGLHISGLTRVKVASANDVNEVFSLGHANRSTACTNMNERSSRSHSVLTITVIGENTITKTQVTGKLNLVDLAGSERVGKSGSEGVRMKEAQNINKSLSALGDVIHALRSKSAHVPYRNTKLTYMLQDSLGGDSKTLMVVQVSPVDKNAGETICSLNFAQRVRQVELGTASRKVRKLK